MNHRESAQAKDHIRFGHDVAYRVKLIDHHLLSISEADKFNGERKIREIRQLLSEITKISNDLYRSGMTALEEFES